MSQNDVEKKAHDDYQDWIRRGRPKNETNPANVARFANALFGTADDKASEPCGIPDVCTCGRCRPAQ